jgi:hypothetical protein
VWEGQKQPEIELNDASEPSHTRTPRKHLFTPSRDSGKSLKAILWDRAIGASIMMMASSGCRTCGDHRRVISGRHLSKHDTDRHTYMEEYRLTPDELIAKACRVIQSHGKDEWIAAVKEVYKQDGKVCQIPPRQLRALIRTRHSTKSLRKKLEFIKGGCFKLYIKTVIKA